MGLAGRLEQEKGLDDLLDVGEVLLTKRWVEILPDYLLVGVFDERQASLSVANVADVLVACQILDLPT
ncbi:MAG TPA: hypothetical protein VLL25_10160 [Acidimicrobiales bacterium]|nr:hypothetical protein [Acidimicrobiales bacterium]